MAYTQSDLDKLKKAIATGASRVKFQGHETEFRSLDEMLKLQSLMEAEIDNTSGDSVSFVEFHGGK